MGLVAGSALWTADRDGIALRETTIGAMLAEAAARWPARPALVAPEWGVRWDYHELKLRADLLAGGLLRLGIGAGERVAVLGRNSPEWILLEYALATIGAVLVTVNTAYRAHELGYLLRQGRVAALFTETEFRGIDYMAALREALAEAPCPELRHVVSLSPDTPAGTTPFAALLEDGDAAALAVRQAAVQPGDVAQIQYTSGTTGATKGVMLTHRGVVNNARLMSDRAGFDADTVLLGVMPLFHTAGCVCNVLGMLACGGALVLASQFDPAQALEWIVRERVTVMNAVPTMYLRLLAEPGVREGQYCGRTVLGTAFTGGTSIPPSMLEAMRDAFGAAPMTIMGMTEASPLITQTRPGDGFLRNSTTAGVPLPHTEVKLVDEAGAIVPLGVPGELCIRSYGVTPGYFDMPERTAEAIDAEGWLHSGDLGTLDGDGTLRIVGRIKDMIIRGGENLYPAEIEDLLMRLPGVQQAQVVGVPDPEFGEEAFAFVIPREGAAPTTAELREAARSRFSRHKVPRYIAVVSSFPQTPSGKVKKFELRDLAKRLATAPA